MTNLPTEVARAVSPASPTNEGERTVLSGAQDARHTVLQPSDASPAAESAADTAEGKTSGSAAPNPGPSPLRWLRWYLSSGVGRRLMTMFVLAALLPVSLLTGAAYLLLAPQLKTDSDRDLIQHARQSSLALANRLLQAEAALAAASRSADPASLLQAQVGRIFSGFVLVDALGERTAEYGKPPALPRWDHLGQDPAAATTRSAMAIGRDGALGINLARSVELDGGTGYVAAALADRFLLDGLSAGDQSNSLCILASTGRVFHCHGQLPAGLAQQFGNLPLQEESIGSLTHEGRSTRVAVAALPTNGHFDGARLFVAAVPPNTGALPMQALFGLIFLVVAGGSVLLVLVLSFFQGRRILQPLRELLSGMQRVARRDFNTPVPVEGRDEFGRIARSFNSMAAELGLRFRTLSAFSEIDRTILTSVDMRQVADIAMACIHEISGVKVVSLGLLEADAPGRTRVYIRSGKGEWHQDELPRAIDLSGVDSSLRKWSKSIRLPATYRSMLHQRGAKYLYLLPIARADKVWGVVVLGHDQKTALSTDEALALAGVIDRLAVALSSVARDKLLHDQAHYDSLTGLPNRHYLMDMLTQKVNEARRDREILAVLYIDLDRFKRTNDTLGHAAGDVLLRQAAARIRASVREVDVVARLGGDEFTVVLPRLKEAARAGIVARTLIAALNEPFEIEGHVMYAGGSIGIAVFPKDGQDAAELLKKADTALYLAKDGGRGRYAFFEERMNADASARVVIDRELRAALKNREFRLHYQPQIDLATGEVCAVEALLRWQHPQRGLLAPDAFIDYAEESGLIEAIGSWVLREALHQHRAWLDAGVLIPRVSVNVSAVQLRNASFAAVVEDALTSSTTLPHHLELEVTESLLVEAGLDAVATLERLRERGIEFAVDDFGTGYSSFAYVKQLPANVLKLDRTFIADVVNNPQARIIATAIIEMAHALGKTVVAEGVETAQQAQFLRQNFCARAQGFVFSPALPPAEIPAYVAQHRRPTEGHADAAEHGLKLVHPQPALDAA